MKKPVLLCSLVLLAACARESNEPTKPAAASPAQAKPATFAIEAEFSAKRAIAGARMALRGVQRWIHAGDAVGGDAEILDQLCASLLRERNDAIRQLAKQHPAQERGLE